MAELDQEYKALTILIEGNSYNSGDIFTGAKYVFIDHYISKTASSWKLGPGSEITHLLKTADMNQNESKKGRPGQRALLG